LARLARLLSKKASERGEPSQVEQKKQRSLFNKKQKNKGLSLISMRSHRIKPAKLPNKVKIKQEKKKAKYLLYLSYGPI